MEVVGALAAIVEAGVPLVVCNAPYDLTLLDSELTRHAIPAPPWAELHVIDPLVLDRRVDRYRSGSRKLADLCAFYEVAFGRAHSAKADAEAARRLAQAIAARHADLAAMDLAALHAAQVAWQAEQAAGLQAYYRRRGSDEIVESGWPRRARPLASRVW